MGFIFRTFKMYNKKKKQSEVIGTKNKVDWKQIKNEYITKNTPLVVDPDSRALG